ncbi:MAG: magnesium/cobalt efflux protein [Gammaproteobacteria bacterium]|nr:MAG: magnesium/cobalt efflux protein [Gammaproteobacteria bacterium]
MTNTTLFIILFFLIIISGFFSGSETALMKINRHRLKYLKNKGHKAAIITEKLLQRTDKLIGIILLGNNFVNILASAIATIIAMRISGEGAIAIATGTLTLVILIFAELAPKTLGAHHPEKFSFISAYIYRILLFVLYPLIWFINLIANNLLKLFGVSLDDKKIDISRDELRNIVEEASGNNPHDYLTMLTNVIDLEKITIDDIMIPRNKIIGIDINESWQENEQFIVDSPYIRLPVYSDTIDNIKGIIHLKTIINSQIDKKTILDNCRDPIFAPQNTSLTDQLLKFQLLKRRTAFVVDEYGSIVGLSTLEDILEEIVGDFTNQNSHQTNKIIKQSKGSYVIDASISLRLLNSSLGLKLPLNSAKTLNGYILEYLKDIPKKGVSFLLQDNPLEVMRIQNNQVRTVKLIKIK